MGFCTNEQHEMFNKQVVQFEDMLIEDGIHIFKLWFSIEQEEQMNRLNDRVLNPLKQWKLSSVDVKAQSKWEEFTKYKLKMFKNTGTKYSPWIIVNGNVREIARKESMRCVLDKLEYNKKGTTKVRLSPDKNIVKYVT